MAPLGIPHDGNKQTSNRRALNAPSDDPALRNQSFVISAVLADIDAIQDLFVLRRHFAEKRYVVNPRNPS